MALQEIYLSGGEKIKISGGGYELEGTFSFENENSNSKEYLIQLLQSVWFNSRAFIEDGKRIGDPTELALVAAAHKYKIVNSFNKTKENPFSSERKMMSSFGELDGKKKTFCKGCPRGYF